jgi:hypothetical protein
MVREGNENKKKLAQKRERKIRWRTRCGKVKWSNRRIKILLIILCVINWNINVVHFLHTFNTCAMISSSNSANSISWPLTLSFHFISCTIVGHHNEHWTYFDDDHYLQSMVVVQQHEINLLPMRDGERIESFFLYLVTYTIYNRPTNF